MNDSPQVLQLLREIKSSLDGMQGPAIITALVGMSGVGIGSLVTGAFQLWVSRASAKNEREKLESQLKADIISRQRQQWMDSVREAAQVLLAEYDLVYNLLQSGNTNQERIDALFFSSMTKANLIELKLNPHKKEQQAVATALLNIQSVLQRHANDSSTKNDKRYDDARAVLKSALQSLFRETWLKIKALES